MNYDHFFHAGNPADVVKHAALVLLLRELTRKDGPIHYVETHAGAGWYALSEPEGEWRQGVARLLSRSARRRLPELSPYLDLLPVTEKGTLERYPGSPALAQAFLREQDTLQLYELHPEDRTTLDRALNVRGDRRVETFCADGYRGLLGTKPKGDARLVAHIDPPFEQVDEWDAIDETVRRLAVKRPGSTVMLWYPVKSGPPHEGRPEALRTSLERARTKGAAVELVLRGGLLTPRPGAQPKVRGVMTGTGLLFVDAPHRALARLAAALPELGRSLARPEDGLGFELRWWSWG